MHISELDTPALLVDLDVMERNLQRAADYARAHHLRLRPHTKTHKSPLLGRKQLEYGAAGLTVAKVSEAEVMSAAGTRDLLVAYPVVGARKLARLLELARSVPVTVALDGPEAAEQLSQAAEAAHLKVGVLAEMDVGLGRVGVNPGDELVRLSQLLAKLAGLEFRGIAFYPGHIKSMNEDGMAKWKMVDEVLKRVLEDFHKAGLPLEIISGGSTPALYQSHRLTGLNEIRPGTYIFNDRNTVYCGSCDWKDCAATILTTVVSTARAGNMIFDGGSKTFSSDRLAVDDDGTFGRIVEAPEARFYKMNEEHGYVDLRPGGKSFRVGDRVRVIPNHICVAVNLHEMVYGVRDGEVVESWPVEGRGKLQ